VVPAARHYITSAHSAVDVRGASAPTAPQQLTRQQQQLAGLAAAVAANSSTGPLQAPLMAQVAELSSKIGRVEGWCEAQADLLPEWREAIAAMSAVRR
jgi:hypothetical protein